MAVERQLSREQFDAVVRRAAELAARESETTEAGLTEAELYRIAGEVGLPAQHVRRALSEVRAAPITGGAPLDRMIGPRLVWASRIVRGTPEGLAPAIDTFMTSGRLLQRVRRSPTRLQYRQAIDWMSQLARAASGASRKHYVAASKSVEVALEAVDADSTLVTLSIEPGVRGDYVGGAFGGGIGTGVGAGMGVGFAAVGWLAVPEVVAVGMGAAALGGVTVGFFRIMASAYRRKLVDIRAEVEGILDQLESGEPLEPPPPSWRKWVEEQFHGARRLLDPGMGGS